MGEINDEASHGDVPDEGLLLLPSLVFSAFATWIPWVLAGLLLIDIGESFGVPVGLTGQIRTLSSLIGVLMAFIMGALSVRFSHKALLLISLSFIALSALACSAAPNFLVVLLSYSILGIPMATVLPMTTSLVADHLPVDERAGAVGWIIAGTALAGILGAPAINYIAGMGGWRLPFLIFILPINLLSIALVLKGIPPKQPHENVEENREEGVGLLEGFREVYSNTSAIACILGYALSLTAFQAIGFYSPSFYRQHFMVSKNFASLLVSGLYLCLTLGSLASGRLVDSLGRKRVTVSTAVIAGILVLGFTNTPDRWVSLTCSLLGYFFAGALISSSHSLALEQIPKFRGTVMSLNSGAEKLGAALGSGLGGLVINLYGWSVMGVVLGVTGVASSMTYQLLAVDPTTKGKTQS
ncbi:MAG: MFS transporter [Candidatus Bathyarchaeia archaeon]